MINIEPMESRVFMSGDSVWVDLSHPVMTTAPQSTAMLLPAVQAAREAARRSIPDGTSNVVDGTSNTIMIAELYK
jgi:hypothetical protein